MEPHDQKEKSHTQANFQDEVEETHGKRENEDQEGKEDEEGQDIDTDEEDWEDLQDEH